MYGSDGIGYSTIFFSCLSTVNWLCIKIEAIGKIVALQLAVTFLKAFFSVKPACGELAMIMQC